MVKFGRYLLLVSPDVMIPLFTPSTLSFPFFLCRYLMNDGESLGGSEWVVGFSHYLLICRLRWSGLLHPCGLWGALCMDMLC